MKLTVEESKIYDEVEVIIKCKSIDEDIKILIGKIKKKSQSLLGKKDDESFFIEICNIFYFEAVDNSTFIYCANEVYKSELKLYELEKILDNTDFIRISKSTILNINFIKKVKPLISRKYEVELLNAEKILINRHYIVSFKEKFGL